MAEKSEILKRTSVLKERLEQEVENFKYLEAQLADPTVTADLEALKQLSRTHTLQANRVKEYKQYLEKIQALEEAEAILQDPEADTELSEMAKEERAELEETINSQRDSVELLLLPPDPNEGKSIMMEIRAGTGGDEAALFVADLLKMYLRYAEKNALKAELVSTTHTELGGYKEVVFSVSGQLAYTNLHQEGGTHRVQRIPTTESGGRIHTSAVTVAVMPEADESEIEIHDKDLRLDTYRASGAGGQHVNKTDSAVRITHIPSGVVVSCQDERSQLKNKTKAMRVLRSRLAEQQEIDKRAAESSMKKEQVGSGDRSGRIRTYNFPQGRMTDHRVGFTSYNLEAFMDGEIMDLLDILNKAKREEQLKSLQS